MPSNLHNLEVSAQQNRRRRLEDDDDDSDSLDDETRARPDKRPRNFIARQACEACRARKTRCDEEIPCGFCKSQEIECVYTDKRPTKNEASLSMILRRLKRLETKIERALEQNGPANGTTKGSTALLPIASSSEAPPFPAGVHSPAQSLELQSHTSLPPSTNGALKISFSSRQTINWPGLLSNDHSIETPGSGIHLSDIDLDGPTFKDQLTTELFSNDWLATLSLSTVKGLSDAYFDTFNRIYPFVDRDFYAANALSTVVGDGFNYDIESCLVLCIMALGCLGLKAYEEGGFIVDNALQNTPVWETLMREDVPGKAFFNESRRRIGLCTCAGDMQVSQYYLAAALFYSQAMRPVDQWMMTDRASTNCLIFWTHLRNRSDEWSIDMQSRIFWSALLMEMVIVQEMDLPTSRLREVEHYVPLPKFMVNPNRKRASATRDESYYHYHFLAQIAQRRILTRIREEIYCLNPSVRVANELRQQLDEWFTNLPPALRFGADSGNFSCPAEAFSMSLLRTRYQSAIYHLGRPFLYKALAAKSSVTDVELDICTEALRTASFWPIATDVCSKMESFSPFRYLVCRSYFGTLLIMHAMKHSNEVKLLSLLPTGSDTACSHMLQYIKFSTPLSAALQKDYNYLATLFDLTM